LKFGQISKILKEIIISKIEKDERALSGSKPQRYGVGGLPRSRAKRPGRPAGGGGPAHDQCGPASLGRRGVLGAHSGRSPHPKLTRLPPAGRWLRCGEVFASSTSGEGVTSGEVFTSMNFADCIALIFFYSVLTKNLEMGSSFIRFFISNFLIFSKFQI
jgi:hypothetical protein